MRGKGKVETKVLASKYWQVDKSLRLQPNNYFFPFPFFCFEQLLLPLPLPPQILDTPEPVYLQVQGTDILIPVKQ